MKNSLIAMMFLFASCSRNIIQPSLVCPDLRDSTTVLMERKTQEILNSPSAFKTTPALITIPVVVHIVWNTQIQNIPDAQIYAAIRILNEDFRRNNADTVNTLSVFRPIAADCGIEFCLATVDPNGNPTNGITRIHTDTTIYGDFNSMKYSSLGGHDAWDTRSYMNIWVTETRGYAGVAYFPSAAGQPYDGLVVNYRGFGKLDYISGLRVATHEAGHYLNLYHIFNNSDCIGSDNVDDTPTQYSYNFQCILNAHSCSGTNEPPDMVQNYMDYTDSYCKNIFTQGQKARMMSIFVPGGYRYGLLSSRGCGNTPPVQYSVTVSSGSACPLSGGGVYSSGSTVNVSAMPCTNCFFQKWTENGATVATTASYTFTISANRNLVAVYSCNVPVQYVVSTSSNSTCSTTGSGTYSSGANVIVSALPCLNCTFQRWTESNSTVSTTPNYTFTVSGNRNLVANYSCVIPPVGAMEVRYSTKPDKSNSVILNNAVLQKGKYYIYALPQGLVAPVKFFLIKDGRQVQGTYPYSDTSFPFDINITDWDKGSYTLIVYAADGKTTVLAFNVR